MTSSLPGPGNHIKFLAASIGCPFISSCSLQSLGLSLQSWASRVIPQIEIHPKPRDSHALSPWGCFANQAASHTLFFISTPPISHHWNTSSSFRVEEDFTTSKIPHTLCSTKSPITIAFWCHHSGSASKIQVWLRTLYPAQSVLVIIQFIFFFSR